MTTLQQYLAEVRARQALSYNSNPDVPNLLAMFDKAFEFIEGTECWCEKARRAGYKRCTKCDALLDINAMAKGITGDAELDRFAEALKTTPLKNTENV